MNKIYITDIYDDGHHLFTRNNNILTDNSLLFVRPYLEDLDLIAEFKHNRELLPHYVDNNGDYKLTNIQRAVYASLIKNREKYKKLILLDETNYNPLDEFDVLKQYGIDKTTNAYAQDKTTSAYGQDKTTNEYGEVHTSVDTGDVDSSTTTAPRNDTATDFTTAFDTTNEKLTNKTINSSIQAVDTAHTDARTDETTTDARTDTSTRDARNDTKTRDARNDVITRDARQDEESGRRTNAMDLVEKERRVANHSTLELIVNDTLNFISYAIYL